MGLKVQIKNEKDTIDKSAEIILVNYYGAVTKYLKSIKQIFFGKSLLKKLEKVGGQNPIDAAKIGCSIFHGPYVYNFKEIYEIFKKYGISKKIETVEYLADNLIKDFQINKENSLDLSKRLDNLSKKIFEDTMKNINQFLKDETK